MRVVFRTDSHYKIGTGHVMRCLNLANQIQKREHQIEFLSRSYPNNLNLLIEQSYQLHTLPLTENEITSDPRTWLTDNDLLECQRLLNQSSQQAIDLLIIDHYGIDEQWESQARIMLNVKKILVIDDLANRQHDCDFLLDQSAYLNTNPYQQKHMCPDSTIFFLGPQHALLHQCFLETRKVLQTKLIKTYGVRRIHVSFGGSDPTNETMIILKYLLDHNTDLEIDIVLGSQNPNTLRIKTEKNIHFYQGIPITQMCELLKKADLCIGGGGISSYERCVLAVPSIVITVAENQIQNALNLDKLGAITYLGHSGSWTLNNLSQHLDRFLTNPEYLRMQSQRCYDLMGDNSSNLLLEKILVKHK